MIIVITTHYSTNQNARFGVSSTKLSFMTEGLGPMLFFNLLKSVMKAKAYIYFGFALYKEKCLNFFLVRENFPIGNHLLEMFMIELIISF